MNEARSSKTLANYGVPQELLSDNRRLYRVFQLPTSENYPPVFVQQWKMLSLSDIGSYYNVPLNQLDQDFRETVQFFSTSVVTKGPREVTRGHLTKLFHYWQATLDKNSLGQNSVIHDALSSVPNFFDFTTSVGIHMTSFERERVLNSIRESWNGFQTTGYLRAARNTTVKAFSNYDIAQMVGLGADDYGFFEYADPMVLNIARRYAASRQIIEMVSSRQKHFQQQMLFHDVTNPLSAISILVSGAIYSADKLLKLGIPIRSGEFIESQISTTPKLDVHASRTGVVSSNIAGSFFGDESITFIINESKQEEFMRIRYHMDSHALAKSLRRNEPVRYLKSDNIVRAGKDARQLVKEWAKQNRHKDSGTNPADYESFLGPEVPLANVAAVAVPNSLIPKMAPYIKKYQPHIQVLVREAALLVNKRQDLFIS